jgi:hypothetical protein
MSDLEVGSFSGAEPPIEFLVRIYVMIALVVGVGTLLTSAGAMLITAIGAETFSDRRSTLGQIFRASVGRFLPAAVSALTVGLCVFAGLLLCCAPAVPIAVLLVLAVPLVMLERRGPFSAIGRSYQLVVDRGPRDLGLESNWVRVFIVGLVTVVVVYVLYSLAGLPVSIGGFSAAMRGAEPIPTPFGPQFVPLSWLLPLQLLGAVLQGMVQPLAIIPWTVVYFDIRTRHEGLDLERSVAAIAAEAGDSAGEQP